MSGDLTQLGAGRFVSLVARNGWEFATCHVATGCVAVAATTAGGQLILIEQYREPVRKRVIELPAGLVGDTGDETHADAARRELLEESGHASDSLREVGRVVSSAGITDETVVFFHAENARREAAGGGVGGERIETHLVPLADVYAWLDDATQRGCAVDVKVYAAIALLTRGS